MTPSNRPVLIAAMLALLAKLCFAALTVGSNDALAFYLFGKAIAQMGLGETYINLEAFNHTPLVGGYISVLARIYPHGPQDMEAFPFFLRLPGILADVFSLLVLLRLAEKIGTPPMWALVVFALSPVALMVSGFHGNVDSVLALLMLCAAWMAAENRPALSGLALGLACNVKVSPLLVIPVFFFWWWERRRWLPFSSALAACIVVGWLPGLLADPHHFISNVIGYPGYWGIWGYSFWLSRSGVAGFQTLGFQDLHPAQLAIMAAMKYLIIAVTLAAAWLRRKADARGLLQSLALVWAVFFVCATGIAPQYFVWFLPFLVVASPRWFAALTATASLFLFAFYNCVTNSLFYQGKIAVPGTWIMPWNKGWQPWNYAHSFNDHQPHWGPWQTLPWLVCIGTLVWLVVLCWRDYGAGEKVSARGED